MTEEEKDEMLERYDWFTEQGGELDRSRIPTVKPAYGGFFFDDDGYFWVGAMRAVDAAGGFDVFDPAGRYLGPVYTPNDISGGLQALVVYGDRIYGAALHDLNVPYVVRGRISGRDRS